MTERYEPKRVNPADFADDYRGLVLARVDELLTEESANDMDWRLTMWSEEGGEDSLLWAKIREVVRAVR